MIRMFVAVLLCASLLVAGEPKTISTKWNQLPAAVEGRKLTVGLKSGKSIKGALAGHDANGLTIDQGRKRGSQTVSRQDIAQILAARKQRGTKGRAIGTAAGGAGAAVIVGSAFRYLDNEGGVNNGNGALIAILAVALGAGSVALGYSIGDVMDGAPIRVQIPDLIP